MDTSAPHPDPVPAGGTLLGVWAHPDDEAYLSAGLMARVADRGGRVVVVYATRGEQGTDDPVAWPPARLAHHREAEARAALAVVGAEPPRFLGLADGACDRLDPTDGAAMVAALLDEVRPDAIVGFGSDGITGHPDHVAVSSWMVGAWLSRPGPRPRLLLAAMATGFLARHRDLHERIGLFPPGGPRATSEADLTARLGLDETELDRKRRVLAAHASQTTMLAEVVGEAAYRRWWRAETFRSPDWRELAAAPLPRVKRPPGRVSSRATLRG